MEDSGGWSGKEASRAREYRRTRETVHLQKCELMNSLLSCRLQPDKEKEKKKPAQKFRELGGLGI